ncbi:MAG: aspartate-semialdehyde dehydrogenase [Hadesarchaea archaeon]|nr:aspartate-semialdehyde dehydrogenase [Hadesarchaea archaeon]
MAKIPVAVLGATGTVGQHFVKLLLDHPWFELAALTASERSAGKRYGDAAKWYLSEEVPEQVADVEVRLTEPRAVEDAKLLFSAMPAEEAAKIEPVCAEAGFIMSSNSSNFRMDPDVPLIIPEVNPDHLKLIEAQKKQRGWDGFIVKNPNCTTIVFVLPLKPLLDAFGINSVLVASMQALSGAGYAGVPSMAIEDNVIPFIAKEEGKTEDEPLKLLGKLSGKNIEQAPIRISASCHRVPVLDGHTTAVFVELGKPASPEEAAEVLSKFKAKPQKLKLPSAPEQPVIVSPEENMPQPRYARYAGSVPGMAVVVGRVRKDPALKNGIKFIASGHNVIRGAAGAAVLNAELLKAEGYLK